MLRISPYTSAFVRVIRTFGGGRAAFRKCRQICCGRFALAEDHLGKSLSLRTRVIDAGVADVFVREILDLLGRRSFRRSRRRDRRSSSSRSVGSSLKRSREAFIFLHCERRRSPCVSIRRILGQRMKFPQRSRISPKVSSAINPKSKTKKGGNNGSRRQEDTEL